MGRNMYIGVDDTAKRVKKIYIGVGGTAKKVLKGYIGVGGKAKLFFSSECEKHSWVYPTDELGHGTCEACGFPCPEPELISSYTQRDATQHNYNLNCTICGFGQGNAEDHTWNNGICKYCDYVCKHEKTTESEMGTCECGTPLYGSSCDLCGIVTNPPSSYCGGDYCLNQEPSEPDPEPTCDHDLDSPTSTVSSTTTIAPTCGDPGTLSIICSTCGATWKETIEPTGDHQWNGNNGCDVCGLLFCSEFTDEDDDGYCDRCGGYYGVHS